MQSPVSVSSEESNENTNIHEYSHVVSQANVATTSSILTERAVAAATLDVHVKSGSSSGKRKGRQGQKSKEAYNRKRRDKKKQERRERAATARQLKSGPATLDAIRD